MQRLVYLIDGVVILLFLWFVFNVIHAMLPIDNSKKNSFLWLSNKIRGVKNEENNRKENKNG